MPTSSDYVPNDHERDEYGRRVGDTRPSHPNWAAIGVMFAITLNLAGWIWIASARNSDVLVIQTGLGELKSSVQALSAQTVNNSVRLGVVESKVDDLRDAQRIGK